VWTLLASARSVRYQSDSGYAEVRRPASRRGGTGGGSDGRGGSAVAKHTSRGSGSPEKSLATVLRTRYTPGPQNPCKRASCRVEALLRYDGPGSALRRMQHRIILLCLGVEH